MLDRLARTKTKATIRAAGAGAIVLIAVLLSAAALPAIARRNARLELADAVIAAESRLERTRSQIESDRAEIRTLLASQATSRDNTAAASLDRRLLDVSAIATELGLFVDSIEPATVSKSATGERVTPIAAAGHGSFARVAAFIHLLHERVPDVTVDSMQLTTAAEGACAFRLSLNWWESPVATNGPQLAGGLEEAR